jgi:hypothetical protein
MQSRKARKEKQRLYLNVAYDPRKSGVNAPKTLMRRHLNRHRRQPFKPMVNHTDSGILKDKPDEAHRRLQQGFEALRPAFSCNRKVYIVLCFCNL